LQPFEAPFRPSQRDGAKDEGARVWQGRAPMSHPIKSSGRPSRNKMQYRPAPGTDCKIRAARIRQGGRQEKRRKERKRNIYGPEPVRFRRSRSSLSLHGIRARFARAGCFHNTEGHRGLYIYGRETRERSRVNTLSPKRRAQDDRTARLRSRDTVNENTA